MKKIPVKTLYDVCETMLRDHWGYIWGTAGVLWTAEKQKAVTNEMAQKYGSKWIGHFVTDCSGVMVYIWKLCGMKILHGSNSIRRQSVGALTNLPKPGYAAFKVRGDDYYHIGIVAADGQTVYEAQGTIAGFTTTPASRWDCFAPFKDVQYEEVMPMPDGDKVIYRAEVITESGPLNVRSGPGTQYDKIGKLPKGEIVDVMVECPNGWMYVDDDGDQGYVDGRYLRRVDASEPSSDEGDQSPSEPDQSDPGPLRTILRHIGDDNITIELVGKWEVYGIVGGSD